MQVSLDEVLRGLERAQDLVLDGSLPLSSAQIPADDTRLQQRTAAITGRDSGLDLCPTLPNLAGQDSPGQNHEPADTHSLRPCTNEHEPTAAARLLFDLAVQEQTHKDARRTGLHPGWITLGEARALARDAGIRRASDAVLVACVRGDIAGATRKGQAWIMLLAAYWAWERERAKPRKRSTTAQQHGLRHSAIRWSLARRIIWWAALLAISLAMVFWRYEN